MKKPWRQKEPQLPFGDRPETFTGCRDSSVKATPDGGWGWIVVFGSFVVHLIADGIVYAFGVIAPDIISYYGSTRQNVGWINSILVGITFLSGPVASKMCAAFGFRIVTILGGLVGAVGLVAPFFSSSFACLFLMTSVVGGFGFGLAYLPSICVVSSYFDRRRALAVGFAVCGSGVGTFVFGPVMGFLLAEYSWRGTMLIIGGIMLNCCACGALYRPLSYPGQQINASNMVAPEGQTLSASDKFSRNNETDDDGEDQFSLYLEECGPESSQVITDSQCYVRYSLPGTEVTTSSLEASTRSLPLSRLAFSMGCTNPAQAFSMSSVLSERASTQLQTSRVGGSNNSVFPEESSTCKRFCDALFDLLNPYLLRNPVFILFAVSNFLTSLGFNAPFLFAVDRALIQGIHPKAASFLISSIGIGNTVGRLLFGALATQGSKHFRIHLYASSLVLCGIITAGSFLATTYPWMIVYTMGFGLFSGTYVTLTPVVLVDLLGADCLNDSFGLTLVFMGIAVFVGPPLAGAIFDATKSYDMAFAACGFVIFVSGAMMYPVFCLPWSAPSRTQVTV